MLEERNFMLCCGRFFNCCGGRFKKVKPVVSAGPKLVSPQYQLKEPSREVNVLDQILKSQLEKNKQDFTILELAGGDGTNSIELARRGYKVIFTDRDYSYLPDKPENTFKKFQDSITYQQLNLSENISRQIITPVNAIFFRLGIHFFGNSRIEAMAKELFDTLKPGGVIIITAKSKKDPLYLQSEHIGDGMCKVNNYSRNFLDLGTFDEYFSKVGFLRQSYLETQEILYKDPYKSDLITLIYQKPADGQPVKT